MCHEAVTNCQQYISFSCLVKCKIVLQQSNSYTAYQVNQQNEEPGDRVAADLGELLDATPVLLLRSCAIRGWARVKPI